MATASNNLYRDYPLRNEHSIRVITVLGLTPDGSIECELSLLDVDTHPVYYCLSYVWNEPELPKEEREKDHSIICHGRKVSITPNLYLALRTLLDVSNDFTSRIWVDAICINQLDVEEKSKQVGFMNAIYRSAKAVVVWLGPEDDRTATAVNVIKLLASAHLELDQRDVSDPIPTPSWMKDASGDIEDESIYSLMGIPFIKPDEWTAYVALLERSWFTRAWTFQEDDAAEYVVYYCGRWQITKDELEDHHLILRDLCWLESGDAMPEHRSQNITSLGRTYENAREQIHLICNKRAVRRKTGRRDDTIFHVFGSAPRGREATDPRDHLYCKADIIPQDLIIPDYKKPCDLVFTEAARAIEQDSGRFAFRYVEDHSFRSLPELPSWVPDYSAPCKPRPFSNTGGDYRACGNLPKVLCQPSNSRALGVFGSMIDIITDKGGSYHGLMCGAGLGEYLAILDSLDHVYVNGKDRVEAFWRTLVANRTGCGTSEPNTKWSSSFREYLALIIINYLREKLPARVILEARAESTDTSLDFIRRDDPSVDALMHTLAKIAASDTTGSMPDPQYISTMISEHYDKILATKNPNQLRPIFPNSYAYFIPLRQFLPDRCLFRGGGSSRSNNNNNNTKIQPEPTSCYIGLGPKSLLPGDSIWILHGGGQPVILRGDLHGDTFRLVGEAFVYGVMEGELENVVRDGGRRVEIV